MTTSQSRNLRKAGAVALSLALAMSTLAITPASAAKKVKLAKTKITVNVGKTKTVKIKNVKKKQVKKLTVKSSKTAVAKAKASKKTAIKVTGKKAGSAKVTANLKLKKKVGGKKAYKLTLKVTVKKAAPAPVEPTTAPTAAPTPVVSGASISLDKPAGYNCEVNGPDVTITANIIPATSNEEVQWSVGDTAIASVSGTGATVNGVATAVLKGLKEGKTTVTAKIAADSVSAVVNVDKEKIYAKITGVKQTKSNEVVVSFDKDARKDNQGFAKGKFDVDVKNVAGVQTVPVDKLVVDAVSGTSATLTLGSPFNDKDDVTVNLYKGSDIASSFNFVASVGAPAGVGITKNEFQNGVEEKVGFAVYDANAIDITPSMTDADKDARVKLSLSTDFKGTSNIGNSSNATITMDTVGSTATLTVEYTSATNTTGKPDFTKSDVIKCIDAKAVVGTGHFQKYDADNEKSWGGEDKTTPFYRGKDITSIDLFTGKTITVAFYASEDNGDAINYESYEVKSSNTDIMSAAITSGEGGKFVNIELSAGSSAEAKVVTLNVIAKSHEKPAYYSMNVNVRKTSVKIGSYKITAKRTKVTNAFDGDYTAGNTIEAEIKDQNQEDITKQVSYVWSIKAPESDKLKGRKIGNHQLDCHAWVEPDEDEPWKAVFHAEGVEAVGYTVEAAVYWEGQEVRPTTKITVEGVDEKAYVPDATTGEGRAKMEYKVEGDQTITIDKNEVKTGTARLAAYTGSKFVGYVKSDGSVGDPYYYDEDHGLYYQALATDATKITSLGIGVKIGNKYANTMVSGSVPLYAAKTTFTTGNFVSFLPNGDNELSYVANKMNATYFTDQKYDADIASTKNTYNVEFKWIIGGKVTTKNLAVTVANKLFVPSVSREKSTIGSLDDDTIKDALKTNVDLNCNEGNNKSIDSVHGKYNGDSTTLSFVALPTEKNATVSYVTVVEGGITYYIDGSWGFTQAS